MYRTPEEQSRIKEKVLANQAAADALIRAAFPGLNIRQNDWQWMITTGSQHHYIRAEFKSKSYRANSVNPSRFTLVGPYVPRPIGYRYRDGKLWRAKLEELLKVGAQYVRTINPVERLREEWAHESYERVPHLSRPPAYYADNAVIAARRAGFEWEDSSFNKMADELIVWDDQRKENERITAEIAAKYTALINAASKEQQ